MVSTGFKLVHGVLEDHRDLLAPQIAHLRLVQGQQVLAFEDDLATVYAPRRPWQQPHHGQVGDALAAAGFSDQSDRLALVQVEGNPIDRIHRPVVGPEADDQVVDGEKVHRRLPLQARVESLAQPVAQQVEADGGYDDHGAREEDQVRSGL